MSKKQFIGASAPKQSSNDVLETSEMLRAGNALLRTSEGIIFLLQSIIGVEVFSESELKDLSTHFNAVFSAMAKSYARLMQHYSSLKEAEEVEESRKRGTDAS